MDQSADAELVQQIAEGGALRHASETALCRRFAPRIRLYGCKHLRDEDRARDLVQVVLTAVIQAARAGRIDDPARLDRFVLGTCRNSVARMRQNDARTPLASEEALAALASVSATLTVERVDTDALFGCLGALDGRARSILMMSFLEERSADEIAAALVTSAGNIRVIRHRAVAAVRQCLDSKEARA